MLRPMGHRAAEEGHAMTGQDGHSQAKDLQGALLSLEEFESRGE